jgi:CRISPR/Cas system endoribonuclease Cas6 (RAMP superfamily)
MISLKVSLVPKGKYHLKDNYEQELRKLCHHFISQNSFDYIIGSNNEKRKSQMNLMEKDIKISRLMCPNSEKSSNYISFHDEVNLFIGSHSYDLIMQLVQGLYKARIIQINNDKFDVHGLEVYKNFQADEFSEVS